jgi:hypothetical protein
VVGVDDKCKLIVDGKEVWNVDHISWSDVDLMESGRFMCFARDKGQYCINVDGKVFRLDLEFTSIGQVFSVGSQFRLECDIVKRKFLGNGKWVIEERKAAFKSGRKQELKLEVYRYIKSVETIDLGKVKSLSSLNKIIFKGKEVVDMDEVS